MRGEGSSDVVKVWLYAAASVMLGSWITPLVYNAGKALSEVSGYKRTNGGVEWLAGLCGQAELREFFMVSQLLAGAVLFLPFMESLRGGRGGGGGQRPWGIRVPDTPAGAESGQRLRRNPLAFHHVARGFVVVTALFLLIGCGMVVGGVLSIRLPSEGVGALLFRCLWSALLWSLVQEVVFRGVFMGIFLRAMRPAMALGMSAALFSLAHALRPPPGLTDLDPEVAGAGFFMLEKTLNRFADPAAMVGTVVPMLVLGGVLAFARWRTASLWLPIGLHGGWIFISSLLGGLMLPAAGGPHAWALVGGFSQGLLPVAGILVSALLIEYLNAADAETSEAI